MVKKPSDDYAQFGFRRVPKSAKTGLVHRVFDSVAGSYDLMNDLMSAGVHRLWKRAMIAWLAPRGAQVILDVAGGTGDIAERILERAPSAHITVIDLNVNMLEAGRDRAVDRGHIKGLDWVCANAEDLPVRDRAADAYTIAFGIRNVTDIPKALAEARRVLKPGGRFLCLEFSHLKVRALQPIYERYSFEIVPRIGQLVAGQEDAYRYLVESIRHFPDQRRFAAMIEEAGFALVKVRDLSGGIAALHSAWRL
jgi:demethylmenaquinone methyltransferase/2-methoxy-6-polyprenyl-1,4-benzoquinol methylase